MLRRDFLSFSPYLAAAVVAPGLAWSQIMDSTKPAEKPKAPEPIDLEMVKEFVVAGHNDLDKVKSMLNENPNLALAAWDWGGGDFETALEGAGHVGQKEIAHYLIERGARPNIFVLTMLGEVALVKAMLERFPALLRTRGPHGLTLLHHAQKGGEDSIELVDYLQSLGITRTKEEL